MSPQRVSRWLPVVALLTAMLAFASVRADDEKKTHAAVKPVPREQANWKKRHESFVDRAKQGNVDVLFLGDSITQGWEGAGKAVWKKSIDPLKAANFGIGGDRTEHVLWRITEGKELEGINPKVAVIMIGTNNTGSNSAEEIAEGITAIAKSLRQQRPETKILLLGVFPRSANATDMVRDKIKEINRRIAKLEDGKTLRYLDIAEWFLVENGNLPKEIMPDRLHLSELGYMLWAAAIQVPLQEMLKQ